MNSLPIHSPELRTSKFRNPSGVNTKLANFRYVDPDRPGGLSGASRLDYSCGISSRTTSLAFERWSRPYGETPGNLRLSGN